MFVAFADIIRYYPKIYNFPKGLLNFSMHRMSILKNKLLAKVKSRDT